MAHMVQEDQSSSVTSSPLQCFSMLPLSPRSPFPYLEELKSEERGLCLIHLLVTCGNHVASGNLENANIALEQISHLASPTGDTIQRIASYFAEAFADRILKNWSGLYKALNSNRMGLDSEKIHVKKLFSEILPFLKVGYVVTNQAILEAMEGEKMIHVIDLDAVEPAQWIALLQVLAARSDRPPHLRITGIHQHKEVLENMAHKLTQEAEKLDIPFQFNPVISTLQNLDFEKLRVKTGEALAISSVLQLHSLLGSDDDEISSKNEYSLSPESSITMPLSSINTKIDSFLNGLWALSPKIMVVTEQDSNHNGATLMERLLESLYYYAALFDCLESTASRTSMERLKVEKMIFGEEIKNIVACERGERKERHEKLEKWMRRFDMAGFGNVGLSYCSLLQAGRLVHGCYGGGCVGYRVKEENGCAVICWQDRALYSVSAWRCRR